MLTFSLKDADLFRPQAYIGGHWCGADNGATFEVNNPATEEVRGVVPKNGCGGNSARYRSRPSGRAIEKNAAADVRVLVVGNPCNTNCLIAMNSGKGVPSDRWFAMTRLDENRAKSQLALKAGTHVSSVSNLAIWGNHSSTQYPDFYNAKIDDKPATEVIKDEPWLKESFIPIVQQRGAAIIKARGASSAASAANAAVDTVWSLINPTPAGDWHSVAVYSDGSYGVEKGLISSFPIRTVDHEWEIVQKVSLNDFSRRKIDTSVDELKEEKELVARLLD
jgi:malate dehydrogenase